MNKIYKVIWCHIRNTYVVASELASRKKIKGKPSSFLKQTTFSLVLAGLTAGGAFAAVGTEGGTGKGTSISPSESEACAQAETKELQDIAIGCGSLAKEGNTLYPRDNPFNTTINTEVKNWSTSLGAHAKSKDGSVSVGAWAQSDNAGVALGSQARALGISGVAIGVGALSQGNTSLAIGRQSAATADFAQALGNVSAATGQGSLAMGHSATAEGKRSISIGSADIDNAPSTGAQNGTAYQTKDQTLSTGQESIAIGAAAKALADFALAMGADSHAEGKNSSAIGNKAKALGADSFAAGRESLAEGDNAFALGANAKATGIQSFALGANSIAAGENAISMGSSAQATGDFSLAIGEKAEAKGDNSLAIGEDSTATGIHSLAIGKGSNALGDNSLAIGEESNAEGINSLAIGKESLAKGAGSTSVGFESQALGDYSTAFGVKAKALGANAFALGASSSAYGNNSTALGLSSQAGGVGSFAFGLGASAASNNSIAFGTGAMVGEIKFDQDGNIIVDNTTENAIAIGSNAKATQANTLALGTGAIASGNSSIAIGSGSIALEDNSVSFGSGAYGAQGLLTRKLTHIDDGIVSAISKDAINGSQLFNTHSKIAEILGGGAGVDADGNITGPTYTITDSDGNSKDYNNVGGALDALDKTVVNNTTNIANNTKNIANNKVAIDQNRTDIQNITLGSAGLIKLSNGQIVIDNDIVGANKAVFNFANKDKSGRKLTGVADGLVNIDSLDAINGSQLFAVNRKIAEVLGGGARLNEDGGLLNPSYQITNTLGKKESYNNVGSALDALDKTVGNNTTNIAKNTQNIDKNRTDIQNITKGGAGLIQLKDQQIVIDNTIQGADKAVFNFANQDKTGRKVTGVGLGAISKSSLDAINGSQLYNANNKVAEILGAGAGLDGKGNLTNPTYTITDTQGVEQSYNNVGSAFDALDLTVANNTTNIANNKTNIDKNRTDINNITQGGAGLIKLAGDEIVIDNTIPKADNAVFNFANKDLSGRKVTGIAAGLVNSTSLDAINGTQLFMANQKVAEIFGGNAQLDANGNLVNPTYTITNSQGKRQNYNNVGSALGALDNTVANNTTNIAKNKTEIDNNRTDINNITQGNVGIIRFNGREIVIDNDLAGVDEADFNFANDDGSGRRLKGVLDGIVSENSLEAINGSQLFEANKKVAEVFGGGAGVDVDGNLTNPTYNITDKAGQKNQYANVGSAFDALDLTVANNTQNIESNKTAIKNIANGTDGLIKLSGKQIVIDNTIAGAEGATFNFANDDFTGRKLIGVADGEISQDSEEAINGSQLHDANKNIAGILGGGASLDDKGNLTAPTYNITDAKGTKQPYNSVGKAFDAIDTTVANNTQNISNNSANIQKVINGGAGLVMLGGGQIVIDNKLADKQAFNFANEDNSGRLLTGVADGKISGNSVDAINGSQLYDANQNIAGILGGGASLDGKGNLTAPTYNITDAKGTKQEYNNVGSAFDALDNTVASNTKNIQNNTQNIESNKTTIQNITKGTEGLVKLSGGEIVIDNEITGADGAEFNIANKDKTGRTLTGVAIGKVSDDSLDAINGSQLFKANQNVAKALGGGASLDDAGNLLNPNYNITDSNGNKQNYDNVGSALEAIDNTVGSNTQNITQNRTDINNITKGSAGLVKLAGSEIVIDNTIAGADNAVFNFKNSDGTGRSVTGVANGLIHKNSLDAINGSQLFNTQDQLAKLFDKDAGYVANAEGGFDWRDPDYASVLLGESPGTQVTTVKEGFDLLDSRISSISAGKAGLITLTADEETIIVDNNIANKATVFDISGPVDGPRRLTGVKDGIISKNSLDAINGSQLYATQQNISAMAGALGGGAGINPEGKFVGPNYKFISGDIYTNVGSALDDLDGRVTDLATGEAIDTKMIVKLANDKIVIDNMLAKDADIFDIANSDNDRILTGIANGKAANDAVNVSQLTTTVASFGGGAKIDPITGEVTGPSYEIKDELGTEHTYTNVGDALGGLSNSIINNANNITGIESKSAESLKGIAEAFGGAAKFDDSGKLTGVDYQQALGAGKSLDSVYKGFEYVGGQLDHLVEGEAGLVQLGGIDHETEIVIDNSKAGDRDTFNFSNNGVDRTLTGVANGKVDNDAVNISQLKGITDALGGGAGINSDTGKITAPTYNISNNTGETKGYNSVGLAFDALNTTVSNNTTNIANNKTSIEQNKTDIQYIKQGTAGLIKLIDNGNEEKEIVIDNEIAGADGAIFNLVNENNSARLLTGVADGKVSGNSVDAINGSQLYDANKNIAGILGGGASVDDKGNLTAPTFNITGSDKTKGQYHTVSDAFDAIDSTVAHNTQNIENNKTEINRIKAGTAGIVKLSAGEIILDNTMEGVNGAVFNFENDGGEGRKLKGVADGLIAMDSSEVMNGSQLYEANNNIATMLGGGADLDSEGNLTKPTYGITDIKGKKQNYYDVGAAFDAIDTTVANNTTNITKNQEDIKNITQGTEGLIKLSGTEIVINNKIDGVDEATFNFANDDGSGRKVTGVADGYVGENSFDAINGSQLYEYEKKVEAIDGSITTIQGDVIKQGNILKGVAEAFGGNAEVNLATGELTSPNYSEALGLTGDENIEDGVESGFKYVGQIIEGIEGDITILDGKVEKNSTDITNLGDQITNINKGEAGLIRYGGDRIFIENSIAGGATIFDISNGTETRTITGVTDGELKAGSKEAVNAGQLYDTNQNVAQNNKNIGGVAEALGGGAGIDSSGNFKGPEYTFKDKTTHTNVGDALADLDGRVYDLDEKVEGITNGTEGIVKLDGDKIVIDNDLAGGAGTFDISNGDDNRTLTGVEDGKIEKGSKDAINGGQIYESNKSIADIFGGGAKVDKDGYISVPSGAFDVGQGSDLSIHGALQHLKNNSNAGSGVFQYDGLKNQIVIAEEEGMDENTIVNMGNHVVTGVSVGKIEKDSTDAVNGGQLWETEQKIEQNSTQINHLQTTMNYYNTRVNNLERTVHQNRKVASAGISSAMAMSSTPYVDYEKYSMGMGVASYDGEAAMAIGATWKFGENGSFKVQGSYDTQSKAGVGVGVAFSW